MQRGEKNCFKCQAPWSATHVCASAIGVPQGSKGPVKIFIGMLSRCPPVVYASGFFLAEANAVYKLLRGSFDSALKVGVYDMSH
jgi:hypothetical protein